MSLLRVWLDSIGSSACEPGANIKLSTKESSHLVRSLRARRGEEVVLLDGKGLVVEGRLVVADGEGAQIEVVRIHTVNRLLPAIYIAQAMPKGGTMDELVRSCCEAGVAGIFPIETSRCELKLDAQRALSRRERWHHHSIEACKQSGCPWRAEIATPVHFRQWMDELPPPSLNEIRLTASLEHDAEPVAQINFSASSQITWLIGPEGDLSSEEYGCARNAGFRPVVLGPTILRTENAALACVVISQALSKLQYQHLRA